MPFAVVDLPLPPAECSPNCHPATVRARIRAHQVRAAYRRDCALAFCAAGIGALPLPVTVHLDYYLARARVPDGRYRPRDEDNGRAAAKPLQDSLQDAGIVPNDRRGMVAVGRTVLHTLAADHQGQCALIVTLEWPDPTEEQ